MSYEPETEKHYRHDRYRKLKVAIQQNLAAIESIKANAVKLSTDSNDASDKTDVADVISTFKAALVAAGS